MILYATLGCLDMEKKGIILGLKWAVLPGILAVIFGVLYLATWLIAPRVSYISKRTQPAAVATVVLDRAAYDRQMLKIANNPPVATSTASTASTTTSAASSTPRALLWPVKAAYPNVGAILPFKRIIAYYGNFYSTGMGVLGQYPEDEMLTRLRAEVAKWNAADPSTPALPAIDYIVTTAQGSAGRDGKYRMRMPDDQIDKALAIAKKVNGIVILDVQVGLSDLPTELPQYEKYLKMPNVHLAIDPEFAMHNGAKPGTVIGSFSFVDVNYAAAYLAKLVRENHLPPKVLIVHRFTEDMVSGYKHIVPLPDVQIVMDMDGWGTPERKLDTYQHFMQYEPVQFTGFKLFYKNDLKAPSTRILTPADLLKLNPQPLFIQFQ